jgi:glycosyltransferase involved in cell wall biosynthesis
MKIIVDAENIAKARTGIPKVSFSDCIVFSSLFHQIDLFVSKKAMSTLVDSAEYSHLRELYLQGNSGHFRINGKRLTNRDLWKTQIFPYPRKAKLSDFDFSYSSLFPGMYSSVKHCKNIVRLHDPFRSRKTLMEEYRDAKTWKNTFARVLRNRSFLKQARSQSLLVANSNWTRGLFSEFYGIEEERIDVIWPSVGYKREQMIDRKQIQDVDPYLICVMSQRQRKKPLFVINAWAKVASNIGLRLCVVGNINRNELSALALKKIELGELFIYRELSEEALMKLQKNAYASIFASTGEGFGLPIAESLFYGVPVLHNDLEVLQEVSAGVGIEFSLTSEDSLIEAIENLIQNKEMRLNLAALSLERGSVFSHEFASSKWKKLLLN